MASEEPLEVVRETYFDAPTIVKGFTLESHDALMRLGIRPETLNVETRVDIKTLNPALMAGSLPSDKTLVGNIYLFDILNKSSYDGSDFFFLEIRYPETTDDLQVATDDEETVDEPVVEGEVLHGRRRIYFFNGVNGQWEELPSEDRPDEHAVRALIHLPYARLAIFEESGLETGVASWYRYKECDCAASPDYPKGTRLLVTRVDDPSRQVVVTVNDYGPDRAVHPERIIDLDAVAFEQIADLWEGVAYVSVAPY